MESETMAEAVLADRVHVGEIPAPAITADDRIDDILNPAGYHILVRILPPEKSLKRWQNSNLVMPDETRDREWLAQLWALVIKLGPDAYQDERRFQSRWCKAGDHILMRPYVGTRFMVRGALYALINDDTVLAVVTDPGELERV
jgi:co-chaperonin GroES (HSP10)